MRERTKVHLNITIKKTLKERIDALRGLVKRSPYIEHLLEGAVDKEEAKDEESKRIKKYADKPSELGDE